MDWKITPGSAGLAPTETFRFFSLPSPKGGGPAGPEGFFYPRIGRLSPSESRGVHGGTGPPVRRNAWVVAKRQTSQRDV